MENNGEKQSSPENLGPGHRWRDVLVIGGLLALAALVYVILNFKRQTAQPDLGDVQQLTVRRAEQYDRPDEPGSDPLTSVAVDSLGQAKTVAEVAAEKYDSSKDDWDSETLAEASNQQLKELAHAIENPEGIDQAEIERIVAKDAFACGTLRPNLLTQVFADGRLRVRRAEASLDSSGFDLRGADGLAKALGNLTAPLRRGKLLHVHFKQVSVERGATGFATKVIYEASGHNDERGIQQTATWKCHWSYPGNGTSNRPKLHRIVLESYEEAELKTPGGRLFVDCTEAVLGANPSYRQQLLPGINHWLPRICRLLGMRFYGHQGLAVGDVNGDLLDDLYVCDAAGLPNRLYVQQADGTLRDVSAEAEVDWLEDTTSALLVDLDNDGDQDLVVATTLATLLLSNDGRGRFSLQGGITTVLAPTSISCADYDHDGDLDLYLCGYVQGDEMWRGGYATPLPYHDATNGGRNALFRNEGGFRFVDVTDEVGLEEGNTRFSFAAAWEDFDNDGDVDLYVANDFGRNNLYRNDNGRFVNVAADTGVEDIATGMSVSWGDYNRDGLMDLYVGNMYSSAGNRVTSQPRFAASGSEQEVAQIRRTARGNTLFVNAGTDGFKDVSLQAAVNLGRWAWASKFVDLNNDGWQDLVVANGYLTMEDSGDL